MRRLAIAIAAMLPLAAQAEPTVIRIEAKKAGAEAAASGWAAQFPDVVTFRAPGGWTAIALGPMERDAAEARMRELKAAGKIPADSFLAPAEAGATPVAGAAGAERAGAEAADTSPATQDGTTPDGTAEAPAPVTTLPPATPGSTMPAAPQAAQPQAQPAAESEAAPQDTGAPAPEAVTEAAPEGAPPQDAGAADAADAAESDAAAIAAQQPPAEVAPDAPGTDLAPGDLPEAPGAAPAHFIRLQSLKTREEGEAALAEWRKDFPAAGLYQLPNDWFAVTLGPVTEELGLDWLKAFKAAGRAPKDAFMTSADKLGAAVEPGAAPDLPAAGNAPMPPMDQVQGALRWGGYYKGAIDGKSGPKTAEAMAAAVVAERLAPDTPTAMARLIEKRAEWRDGMGLSELRDPHTGLSVTAPMNKLAFQRTERALAIYGPRDQSGAALILFSQPGGQQEMLDLTGLVTALGWVPAPTRDVTQGRAVLDGRGDTHIGHAEATVTDGRAQGFVLIWPVEDAADQPRIAAEIADSLTRFAPAATDTADAESEAATPAETSPAEAAASEPASGTAAN